MGLPGGAVGAQVSYFRSSADKTGAKRGFGLSYNAPPARRGRLAPLRQVFLFFHSAQPTQAGWA